MTTETKFAYCGVDEPDQFHPTRDLEDERGVKIGTYTVVSSWTRPDYWTGCRMHSIRAMVDGVAYWGKTFGPGMSVVLHRCKEQPGVYELRVAGQTSARTFGHERLQAALLAFDDQCRWSRDVWLEWTGDEPGVIAFHDGASGDVTMDAEMFGILRDARFTIQRATQG